MKGRTIMRTDTNIITRLAAISGVLLGVAAVHAVAPPLEMLTPAGGETWTAGETVTILWQAADPQDYVDIYLDKGGAWYTSIGYLPMADGQMDWEICPVIGDGDDYSIRIVGCDAGGGPIEASSAPFAITGSLPRPTLAITYPAGGEVWDVSVYAAMTITWESTNPSGYVYVDLLHNGQLDRELGYVAVGAGSFEWLPYGGTFVNSDDYSIRLSMDACGPGLEATSNVFTFTGSVPPPVGTVTVALPVAGTVWPAGAMRSVTWERTGRSSGFYEVDLYRDGVFYRYLGWSGFSSFGWKIDSRIGDDAEYTVRIVDVGLYGVVPEAFSAPFSIRTTDGDRDGDVDMDDFRGFLDCFNGPNRPPHDPVPFSGFCVGFDQDADGDVDLADFSRFQSCFNGINRSPRCP
ncbi:MAG: hypothetical protein JXA69_06105 [Phycisphaerae bacterium]|nr:hypothetical protein [Phycisphaerae bacterium]